MLEQRVSEKLEVSVVPRFHRLYYVSEADRKGILQVLERAAEDDGFIAQLTHCGPDALRGYNLSLDAQAALLSGDVGWIEANVGKLDARLRTWLDCRLQQEIW